MPSAPLRPFTVDHFRQYARLMVLDTGRSWEPEHFQLELAEDIFGDPIETLTVIPEGNAKTTFLSGVCLYFADYTPYAKIVVAAASRDQAGVLFDQAVGFVERSPGFQKRFRVFEGYRRITALRSHSRIQVFAADDRTGDGVLFDFAAVDEVHRHRDLRLWRTWRGKAHKRGGKMVGISTAGEPGTEFEDMRAGLLAKATSVERDGFHTRAVSGKAVLHDFSVPQGCDVEDIAVVKRANPLAAITEEQLRDKRNSPAMTLNHWLRFVCNQSVRTEESAIDPREWAQLGEEDPVPVGVRVDVGVDLGWKHDRTALVPLWRDGDRLVFGHPEILTPPGDGTFLSAQAVKNAFGRINDRNPIRRVVIDPDRAAETVEWLEEELGVQVVEYKQSNVPMARAYERFVEAVRSQRLVHPMDAEFTEHVLNAVAKPLQDGGAKFDRPSSSRAQSGQRRRVIDGLIAGAMVISVEDQGPSVYEQRGLLNV